MADVDKLVEQLGKLSVIEAAELVSKLEETWGVSAAAPVAVAAAAPAAAGAVAEAAEEKVLEVQSAIADGAGEDLMSKVRAALEAKEQAGKAARKAAKASAKVEEAARVAESMGVKPDKADDKDSEDSAAPESDKKPKSP